MFFLLRSALVPFGRVAVFLPQPLSPGTKRPEREADNSSPFSAEFKYTLSWGVQEQLYRHFTSVVVTQLVKNSLRFRTLKILHRARNTLSLDLNIPNPIIYSLLFAKTNFNTNEYIWSAFFTTVML